MRVGIIGLSALLIVSCDDIDQAQRHEEQGGRVGDMLDKELKEGLSLKQVERVPVLKSLDFTIEGGWKGEF
jgi:hypothetical protein